MTNKEVLEKLLSYSQELRQHYDLYQLLLFHFQEKQANHFFDLIEEAISCVNPIFQTVFKTFLKDKGKIMNALELPYSNAKLEATNNLIKVIKRNAFGFRNFENFKTRILIALNIKRERIKPDPLQVVTFHQPTTVDKEPFLLVRLTDCTDTHCVCTNSFAKWHTCNDNDIVTRLYKTCFYCFTFCDFEHIVS